LIDIIHFEVVHIFLNYVMVHYIYTTKFFKFQIHYSNFSFL